jgi:hypothetical protein
MDEWTKKVAYTHQIIIQPQKGEILPFVVTLMELKDIMSNEIS